MKKRLLSTQYLTHDRITLPGKTSTATSTSSAASATGSSVSGEGYWEAYYDGDNDGCLISGGTWYTTGTCATYDATTACMSYSTPPCMFDR